MVMLSACATRCCHRGFKVTFRKPSGFEIEPSQNGKGAVVGKVNSKFAKHAGVRSGLLIVRVGDQDVHDMPCEHVLNLIELQVLPGNVTFTRLNRKGVCGCGPSLRTGVAVMVKIAPPKTHYETLFEENLYYKDGRLTTQEDIKKAHKTLVRKYHPDRVPGAEDLFRKVQEAYECLSDEKERAKYDLESKMEKAKLEKGLLATFVRWEGEDKVVVSLDLPVNELKEIHYDAGEKLMKTLTVKRRDITDLTDDEFWMDQTNLRRIPMLRLKRVMIRCQHAILNDYSWLNPEIKFNDTERRPTWEISTNPLAMIAPNANRWEHLVRCMRYDAKIQGPIKEGYGDNEITFEHTDPLTMFEITTLKNEKGVKLTSIKRDSEAYANGMRVGTRIVEVNGEDVTDLSLDEIRDKIKEEKPTITFRREKLSLEDWCTNTLTLEADTILERLQKKMRIPIR